MYTLLGIHMLETVAKPMLQMLETQRESSTKKIQSLQLKLEQLSLGNNDETLCDGDTDDDDDDDDEEEYCQEDKTYFDESAPVSVSNQPNDTKKDKRSSMVSSPV